MKEVSAPVFSVLFYVYMIALPYYCEKLECDILSNSSKEIIENGVNMAASQGRVDSPPRTTLASLATSVVLPEYIPGIGVI